MREYTSERPTPVAHEIDMFHKVLHVPPGYGQGVHDPTLEQAQLDIFRAYGYDIVEADTFDIDNPTEMGFGVHSNIRDAYERDQRIAREAGVRMPESYTAQTMLEYSGSIVAKSHNAERGDAKFLLESLEQKQRFVAWAMAKENIGSLFKDNHFDHEIVQDLLAQAADSEFDQAKLSSWIFEEQIVTPGTYNTSFRVVVDAFGQVHYGQVARSSAPKGTDADPSITHDTPLPTSMAAMWGADASILLTHPDSPFYIAPKQVTSNISTGGTRIRLDGVPAKLPEDRTALQELGINPDKPLLPAVLYDMSDTIGKLSRSEYPFVGVDYLCDARTHEDVMLEINTGPQLDPESLGLPADTDEITCDLALLEKILSGTIDPHALGHS